MSDATPVAIFTRWRAEPVFHLARSWEDGGHETSRSDHPDGFVIVEHRTYLECGRVLDAWGWHDHGDGRPWPERYSDEWERRPALILRRDHAEKIGRLCRRCEAAVS